ncbi:MAG: M1 family metallopeptidase [Anaerolineales bacterium]|nr:M1 family metallopeptidase [Anaerolineales bacterium]
MPTARRPARRFGAANHPLLVAALMALAALACTTFTDFFTLEGPEDQATDAFFTVAPPTTTPRPPATPTAADPNAPTVTPVPVTPRAPAGGLPFSLDQADDAQAALRPEFAADAERFPNAARYVIDVAVTFNSDGSATLTGRELIRYTNPEDFELTDLYLMLWPNERGQYLGGAQLVGPVIVGGQPVEPELKFNGLAARLPLAAPLAPGASVDLEAAFTAQVDPGLEDGARYGLTNGVLIAPTFYPLIPRLVQGEWQIEPPPTGGDTTNSDSAFYAWRITAPAGLQIAASGVVVDQTEAGGLQSQTLLTGPMRDLALIVGDLAVESRTAGGVRLNAYLLPGHASETAAVLAQAALQVETLQDEVGPYRFVELDIVDAPGAFGGIEYPGLVLIGVIDSSSFYEEAVVHEVGHQWFYSLIGDDQLLQPWLDEAAASYTELLYYERALGPQIVPDVLDESWRWLGYADDPSLPIGGPVASYGDDYGAIVYGKGALFFDALRRELGDDTFFAFLRAYYDRYVYGFATSAGFQEVAEETCACDLSGLFNRWVFDGGPVERP